MFLFKKKFNIAYNSVLLGFYNNEVLVLYFAPIFFVEYFHFYCSAPLENIYNNKFEVASKNKADIFLISKENYKIRTRFG